MAGDTLLPRHRIRPELVNNCRVSECHDDHRQEIQENRDSGVIPDPVTENRSTRSGDRIEVNDRRPSLPAPGLRVVEPDPAHLFAVDEDRSGNDEGEDPDESDEEMVSAIGHPGTQCEHDAEESVTGDQGQGHGTRHQR